MRLSTGHAALTFAQEQLGLDEAAALAYARRMFPTSTFRAPRENLAGRAPLGGGAVAVAVERTANRKLGDAAATYAAQASCPASCVFLDGGGCYAETGQLGKFVTSPLNVAASLRAASAVEVAEAEAEAIDGLVRVPAGRPLRLHVVGDCASDETARIVAAAAARYRARGGGPVWTYTHGWRDVARDSWGTVSVLASCETAADVELARGRGYAPALVVDEFPGDRLYTLDLLEQPASVSDPDAGSSSESCRTARAAAGASPAVGGLRGQRPGSDALVTSVAQGSLERHGAQGDPATACLTAHETPLRVLPCPAQTRHVGCTDCRLCMDDAGVLERGYAIGFELHGTPFAVRQARQALNEPEHPDRRLTSRELIPRTIAELEREGVRVTHAEIARRLGMEPSSVREMRLTLEADAA